MSAPLIADLPLAQRLERAEAHANMAFVESRRRLAPNVGATWTDVDGTWAMFDGVGSPLTQTFGLGCFGPPTSAHLETLEQFFAARGADTQHEVSTMADPAVLLLLGERGYRPIEWSAVLCQRLETLPEAAPHITVTRVPLSDAAHWADVSARGWAETPALAEFVRDFGLVGAGAEDTHSFLALLDGTAVAAGSLHLHGGVALLAGASTVPEARGRGAQQALLAARLQFARDHGAELAMMVAAPGSASQRNAQRTGFHVVYSRVKWGRTANTP